MRVLYPIRSYSTTTLLPTHVLVHPVTFQYKGIRLYLDVIVREKVEKGSQPYTKAGWRVGSGIILYEKVCALTEKALKKSVTIKPEAATT